MILLDTSAVLWMVLEPHRIGADTTRLLSGGDAVLFSSVSVLEIEIKRQLGRLVVGDDVAGGLASQGLRELAFTSEHAAGLRHFPELVGHDPFDRVLVAQAHTERALFVTSDRRLLSLGRDWIVDTRS